MQRMVSNYRLRNTLVAGGLAVVGALLVFLYISTYRKHVQTGADLVTVLVAGRDIPAGTDASAVEGSLKSETVLRRNVVTGAISHPGNISGLVVSQPILEGQQVTVRQFSPLRQQGVLATISGNLRAIALPGDGTQLLNGIVKDGDHVDVVANIKYTLPASSAGSTGTSLVASRVILRDLRRPPVSDDRRQRPASAGCRRTAPRSRSRSPTTRPRSCSSPSKNGDWWLVLRPVAKPTDVPGQRRDDAVDPGRRARTGAARPADERTGKGEHRRWPIASTTGGSAHASSSCSRARRVTTCRRQ